MHGQVLSAYLVLGAVELQFMAETRSNHVHMIPVEVVNKYITHGFSRATCSDIHPLSCNLFSLNYVPSVCSNTYKTYGAVYLLSLLFRYKKIAKNPALETLKYLTEYVRSTSLTAVQMSIMRRVLCFLCSRVGNRQNNLLIANFLSAFYLLVETAGRQPEIALYQLTNTSRVIYQMLKRRGYVKPLPGGECLLMALSLAVIAFSYFDCKQAFRRNYMLTIFQHLLEE